MSKSKEPKVLTITITEEAYKVLSDWISVGDLNLSNAIISADKRLKKFRNRP